jgi:hypothetical protein
MYSLHGCFAPVRTPEEMQFVKIEEEKKVKAKEQWNQKQGEY